MVFYTIPEEPTVLLFNVFLQALMSAGLVIYVTTCHPFEELKDNYIEIFNESTIFILYVIPLAAIIVDESILDAPSRVNLGYVLIGILLLNLGVNYLIFMLHLLYQIYKKLKKFYKKRCQKKKSKQGDGSLDDAKKNLMQDTSPGSKYLQRRGTFLREVNGVYIDEGELFPARQDPNDPTPAAMFDKDDVRDPLRYMKAEMAKKFGETLTFGNN